MIKYILKTQKILRLNIIEKFYYFCYSNNAITDKNLLAMGRTSYIFLANGFEEIEAITTIDVLRRGGVDVKTVSINEGLQVEGAHGVTVTADALFADVDFKFAEWLIMPGGMPGASNLHEFKPLNDLLLEHFRKGENIAAICASPAVVLAPLGILSGKNATCYPGFEDSMEKVRMQNEPVVVDGNIVTACGPAASMKFALAIVAIEKGDDVAQDIASGMLLHL